jgi:tetratricopeptide (TPR) repeat protein
MSNQIDYSDFVEKYLAHQMKQDELEWFRKEMEHNPSLAEEVQMQKEIGDAILNEETMEFRARISNLFEREENKKQVRVRKLPHIPRVMRVAVASFLAFIMLGGGIYLYNHRSIPAGKLFEIYYAPYEGLANVRSSTPQMTGMLEAAMQKYEQKEYESALLLFETILASDRENITSQFYSGISYLETDRYNVAQKSFTGVIDHNDNLFIEHAEWYLGLCYLKTGEFEMARKLFAKISGTEGYYSKNAGRILRNL